GTERMVRITAHLSSAELPGSKNEPLSRNPDVLFLRREPPQVTLWSGRALQEDFVELAVAVLHQCIRPLIGACCAPSHHGYQRACVLISGQASIGPFGSPVFARARKTDPPFCLVLSQTSAGSY